MLKVKALNRIDLLINPTSIYSYLKVITMTIHTEKESIFSNLKLAIDQIGTVQSNLHNVLIESTLFAFKYKGEGADLIARVLNNLTGVRGSFRVESVAYWYQQVAGIDCKFNAKQDKYACNYAKDSYLSALGVAFTYDVTHLNACKLDANRFWKVAPVVIKDLKLPEDVEKCTNSAEIMLARGLAGGSMTKEEIATHLLNMMARIEQIATTGKTAEWLDSYYLQHPEKKPANDSVTEEIASLVEEERIADLMTA